MLMYVISYCGNLLAFHWPGCLLLILLGLIGGLALYLDRTYRKYDHIPGPPRDSFWFGHVFSLTKGTMCVHLAEMMEEFGATIIIMMVGRPMVVTRDREAVQKLMMNAKQPKSQFVNDIQRYIFGARFMGNAMSLENGFEKWQWKRHILNAPFQTSNLQSVIPDFNNIADNFVDRLSTSADGRREVVLLKEFNQVALAFIGKIAYGVNLYEENEYRGLSEAIETSFEGMIAAVYSPLFSLNPLNWRRVYEFRKGVHKLRQFGKRIVMNRIEASKKQYVPSDILSEIIKMKEEKPSLPDEELLDEFVTFIVAGQETTASALAFTILLLGQNPEKLKKLEEEINEVIGNKAVIEFKDIQNLTYLEMVIQESLRLFPPAPAVLRETLEDMNIGGYNIPAGTNIQMNTYAFCRSSENFKEPSKFIPERFTKDSNSIEAFTYFPFGLGPRTCMGKHLAKMEMKITIAKFIQRFKFRLVDGQSFDVIEIATLRPKDKVRVTLLPREQGTLL